MSVRKEQTAEGYVYKLVINNCMNLLLFYQKVEVALEYKTHLEDANKKLNCT